MTVRDAGDRDVYGEPEFAQALSNPYERLTGRCLPWRHVWRVVRVSVPWFDPGAKGILKECLRCPKMVAK